MRRLIRPRSVIAVALLAAGAGAIVVGSRLPGQTAALSGRNLPVDTQALDATDLTAASSPGLVANPTDPRNLAVTNRIDAPRTGCALRVSFDGGATWGQVHIPTPPGEEIACFAPDPVFGPDGILYIAYTSFGQVAKQGLVPDAAWIVSSRDGGRSLSAPRRAAGPLAFEMRLLADQGQPGRLFLSWVQASSTGTWGFPQTGNPIVVSRSDDGGATWAPAVRVSPPGRARVISPSMVEAGGALELAYLDVGRDALDYEGAHEGLAGPPYPGTWTLVSARSVDGGSTWAETVVDAGVAPAQRFLVVSPPQPSLAVDSRAGRLYVAFQDGRTGDADVALWTSTDLGRSFGPAHRVNDTRAGDRTSQYLPGLAVAPSGRLDVIYYDRRADPRDVMTEVSLQSSYDGGGTFTGHLILSDRPFDSGVGGGSGRQVSGLGSRLGLISTDDGALAVWTDTRAGSELTGKQDLGRQLIAFTDAHAWRRPLELGGAGLVALTAAVLAAAALRHRRVVIQM